ncbi:MAG: hypothetical protein WBG86_14495 [Polyangiales bacterium]
MPCDASHMEPTALEREAKLLGELIVDVSNILGGRAPDWASEGARDQYGHGVLERIDQATKMLCKLMPNVPDAILYDGRSRRSRRLADWWDTHQEEDRRKLENLRLAASRDVAERELKTVLDDLHVEQIRELTRLAKRMDGEEPKG